MGEGAEGVPPPAEESSALRRAPWQDPRGSSAQRQGLSGDRQGRLAAGPPGGMEAGQMLWVPLLKAEAQYGPHMGCLLRPSSSWGGGWAGSGGPGVRGRGAGASEKEPQ